MAVKTLAIALVVLSAVFSGSLFLRNRTEKFSKTSAVMGTFLNQTVVSEKPEKVTNSAVSAIKELESKISWRLENSDIFNINNAEKMQWVKVDKITWDELSLSLKIAEMTGGAFDPAVLPVSKLWDFTSDDKKVPDSFALKKAVSVSGYSNLEIDKTNASVRKMNDAELIDLGGVGKGAACDAALAVYKENNVKNAVVSVGGSVGVYGTKSDKSPFNIAIRAPITDENELTEFAQLKISSGCLSTSGAYERNFTLNGKFYHHILDIKSGYPVKTSLASVTVYHERGILTDILSTACYVLGREKSLPVLEYYNAQAVFVDEYRNVFITEGLQGKFYLTDRNYTLCNWY